MEPQVHPLSSLFDQLGLPSSEVAISQFIDLHGKLPAEIALHEAPFWNPAQATFLKQALDSDADWVSSVNRLDAMLR